MKSKQVLAAVFAAAFLPLALKAQTALSPDSLVDKLDENFRKITTYRADFKQEVRSEQFGKIISQGAGQLTYLKPGKMVWRYSAPEEHWYITDGNIFWDYLPQTRQAMKLEIDQALASTLPKTFLFGLGKLKEQFDIAFSPDQEQKQPSLYHLALTPKSDEDKIMIGTVALTVDAKTFLVQKAELKDSLGNQNSLFFFGIEVNPKIDPKTFQFTPPEGVEVLTAPGEPVKPVGTEPGATEAAKPAEKKTEPEKPGAEPGGTGGAGSAGEKAGAEKSKEEPGATVAAPPADKNTEPEKSNDEKGAEQK
jgi:outer membrane lipoprotein carrier protein